MMKKVHPRARQIWKKMLPVGVHAIMAMLLMSLLMPPALLAQMSPQGHGVRGDFGGFDPNRLRGERHTEPIVTSPEAFERERPSYAPCPQSEGKQPSRPRGRQPRQATLGDEPVLAGNTLLDSDVFRQGDREQLQELQELQEQQEQAGMSLPSSLLPAALEKQETKRLGRKHPSRGPERFGDDLTIEDSFARNYILQQESKRLRQFGYRFFEISGPGRAPITNAPVGPHYVLGPQDSLSLHIWDVPDPAWNRSFVVPIKQDGTVFIPKVGIIPLAGASFSQAEGIIQSRLSQLLKRFEMHLSMARLRTITVYVVGEVERPGAYELSAMSTVSHALYAACGPSKSGSLRRMQVVRQGTPAAELDFYRFLLRGDRTQDIQLQSGDTVLVPPIGPVTAITGPVKRSAIYELKGRTTLTDLIELAGGLLPTADRRRVQVLRVEAGAQRVILNLETQKQITTPIKTGPNHSWMIDKAAHFVIQDGDIIRIASAPTEIENAVKLEGAVRNPGLYQFEPGMHISDVLTADQLLRDSYWERAELVRTNPITYERTVISFDPVKVLKGQEEADLSLERLDTIIISTQAKPVRTVTLKGEVKRPGSYPIERGERLSSVLKRAGGLTEDAYPQGLIFERESVRQEQREEMRKFLAQQKEKVITEAANLAAGATSKEEASQEETSLTMQLQALENMADRIRYGRVVLRMESVDALASSDNDIELQDGDQITVPVESHTVNVLGAVRNATSVAFQPGRQVADYIQDAGGFARSSDEPETFIIRADGSTDSSYVMAQAVRPGDTIVVPAKLEAKTRSLPFWQAVASILGSTAMSVAGLTVIAR